MFFCEFGEISESNFFKEQPPDDCFQLFRSSHQRCSMKKGLLEISQNSQKNTCGLRNFQEHCFYRTPLDDCFWFFPATLLTCGTANSVWKTSDEYSLSKNTNLRNAVQLSHFFLGSINFQCMFSLVYTVYCQKQPPEQTCSIKKGVPKSFVNFIRKRLCWSLFLIKQA